MTYFRAVHMPVREAVVSKAMALNNTTASISLWTVTGQIVIWELYGVVTTGLSSSHTSAGWRIVAGAGVTNLTTLAGTMSSAVINGVIWKSDALASAPGVKIGTAGGTIGPGITGGAPTAPCVISPNTGQTAMTLEYRHTTTNTPESGVIAFHLVWSPLSDGATVV